VLAVNPMSTSRYRERHSTAGAKSDPGDAFVLAEPARTDGHNHRPVAGDSEAASAIKVLALAAAIAGAGGPERVRGFQVVARSPSIRQAAMTMGFKEPAIYTQLVRLEGSCGGALLVRYTRTHRARR
jgi:hypothetical protein